ncbi:unnamed protein product [Rotaria socialis]|uniref:CxC5 like cysteine cluster associated with KDZ domain-containing protein n=3 Tax=Rotaria TaxID=231623 RepID=A0A821VGA8_9BILA|nr:unnamed protein product [Rotaria socialis]
MLNMNHSIGRTRSKDIELLIEMYNMFHPQELHFLIQLNQRWSVYDPNRIQNMTAILSRTFAAEYKVSDTERIIKYFNSHDSIQLFSSITVDMALIQLDQSLHLNPYQSRCPICLSMLDADMADVLSVQVYTLKGATHQGKVFFACCKHINTSFNTYPIVYIYPNFFRQNNMITFTTESLQKYDTVYLGGQHAFERALIENYTCQLISRASSWQKFVDGLNLGAFNSNLTDTKVEWRKRLAMAFIKYKLVEFDLCIGSSSVSIPSSAREFDIWMWDQYPRLLSSFMYLWSNHKTLIKSCGSNCSQCIVIDGHQKCRRRVCRAKNVQVSTEEFESLTVGCCRTPSLGSRFCELHQVLDEKNVTAESLTKQKPNKKQKMMKKIIMGRYRQHGFGATNCRTIKQRSESYIKRCSRSFGILAGVTNCKIVITFSEIFRSETLREIISLLCSTIRGEYIIKYFHSISM